MLAKLAGEFAGDDGSDDDEVFADDLCDDDPTDASNAVLALIHDGKLDEVEAAARSPAGTIPGTSTTAGIGSPCWHGSRKARRKPGQASPIAIERWSRSSTENLDYSEPVLKDAFVARSYRKTRPACHRLTLTIHGITVRDGPALATTTNQDYRARSFPRMPWPGLRSSFQRSASIRIL